MDPRTVRRRTGFCWFVAVAGVVGSLVFAEIMRASERATAVAHFERRAVEYALAIEHRLSEDVFAVESTAAFVASSPAASREDFRRATAHLLARHTSLRALSWNPTIRVGERKAYEARLAAEGCANCAITERSAAGELVRAGPRSHYTVVHFIEPYSSNRSAVGFDVSSEERRRHAIERAATTEEASFTAKIELVQELQSPGFLAFFPVFGRRASGADDARTPAPDELLGFAVGVFHVADVVRAAPFDPVEAGVTVHILDSTSPVHTELLYAELPDTQASPLAFVHTWTQGGRTWQLNFMPLRPLATSNVPWIAMIGGFLATGLVTAYLLSMLRANVELEREIVRRHRAEEEQRRLDAKLQESQRLESLGVLAGGIAHDFNNLLTGVLGHADLALRELPPGSSARNDIEQVLKSATRASDLTRQMLAYSGTRPVALQNFDLSRLVEETAQLLEGSLSRSAKWHRELSEAPVVIEGDQTQIRQIAMNLITNASDAIGDAPGKISLRTGTRMFDAAELADAARDETPGPGRYCFFEIEDTGRGMSETERAHLFEPFFTTKFKGHGLGLSAVLGIVRSHGGAIWVDSEAGRGTRFLLAFPASEIAVGEPAATGSRADAMEEAGAGPVLVVDDEESVRRLAVTMLEREGFVVLTAAGGMDALSIFRENRDEIRAVLLDATMPGMNGVEVFRALREMEPHIAIVYSSGYTEEESLEDLRGVRPDAFLEKPYTRHDLVQALHRAQACHPGVAGPSGIEHSSSVQV